MQERESAQDLSHCGGRNGLAHPTQFHQNEDEDAEKQKALQHILPFFEKRYDSVHVNAP